MGNSPNRGEAARPFFYDTAQLPGHTIVELVGEPVYAMLVALLAQRGRRAVLPHPAVRR